MTSKQFTRQGQTRHSRFDSLRWSASLLRERAAPQPLSHLWPTCWRGRAAVTRQPLPGPPAPSPCRVNTQ